MPGPFLCPFYCGDGGPFQVSAKHNDSMAEEATRTRRRRRGNTATN